MIAGIDRIRSVSACASCCRVPNLSATTRACGISSNSFSAKPIENVGTASLAARAIMATIRLESRPPLRNAPEDPSGVMCTATVSSNLASSRSMYSSCDRRCLSANESFQWRDVEMPSPSSTSQCAGRSLRIPRIIVPSPGMKRIDR